MCKVKCKSGVWDSLGLKSPSSSLGRWDRFLKSGIHVLLGFPKTVQNLGQVVWSRLGCAE